MSYLGIENGLSNNTVTSIYKDKFGLMWFGTLDGINRYDGYSFKVFRNKFNDPASLPNDIITSINSDDPGNIWVGTQKGIGVLDRKTLQFSTIEYVQKNGTAAPLKNWVNGIQKDDQGNIYIAANDIGLLVCKNGIKSARQIPISVASGKPLYRYSVTAISTPQKDKIWITTEGQGLGYYDLRSGRLVILNQKPVIATCIVHDVLGDLWMGTNHGVFHYETKKEVLAKFDLGSPSLNKANISSIIFDKSLRLWIATNGEGLVQIDGIATGTKRILRPFLRDELSSDALFTIMEDERSRKWIGTLRGGIQILDEKKHQFQTYTHDAGDPNSLVNNFTFSFCEDLNKNVWIGTDGGGLSVWNRRSNTFKNYVYTAGKAGALSNNRIPSIVRDQNGSIWIAAFDGGIIRFDVKSGSFKRVNFQNPTMDHSIWRLYCDGNGDIWVLCLRGLNARYGPRIFKYSQASGTFVPAPFEVGEDIVTIVDDDKDHFWMGGFSGIVHTDKKHGVDKTVDLKTVVRALYKSKTGLLWIGTYGRGLMSFNTKTGKYASYTEENGLCNNKVLNIEEDHQGNIWVSTYNGISKVSPATGKILNFYAVDGLQSNQFYYNASARLSSGELIFGGIKGFNVFNPDSIRQVHDFPPLIITGLRIANSAVNAESEFLPDAKNVYTVDHIRLPYDKALLSIDFVALEYSLPGKIQYAYSLKGRDNGWINIGNQRSINYSQLNEGNYVLKIRSTNASGIWNPSVTSISLTILPPWFRTWWAYILYLSGIAASIYGYLYYHKKQTQLHYEVKLVTELNEKKISFFTNISHELRTPLTLIVNPIKELLHSNGANLDLIDISAVYRNSRRLLSLVDQLLLFRSSENEISDLQPSLVNLNDVCHEVFLCFNNQVHAKNLTYEFKSPSSNIPLYADRDKLEIVLFNLLSNAIKYTPNNGMVNLRITDESGYVEIFVSDNGPGIPQETGKKLFEKFYRLPADKDSNAQSGFGIGLFLAKRYIDIHKGELSFTSEAGAGSIFKIRLPKVAIPTVPLNEVQQKESGYHTPLLHELIVDPETDRHQMVKEKQIDEILGGITDKKAVVMLIDDDSEMRLYIRNLLGDMYTVYEAGSAEAALDMIIEFEPDMILCDVVMAGMSGVEFCSKIKESPSFSHIPVILLTGTSSPEIKLKGIECGADDYITKPFEAELLLARIKSMLKGRDTLKDYFFNEITLKNNSLKIPSEYSDFLSKCILIIERHLDDETFALKTFTDEIGMSRSNLSRKIKSISGLSTSEFIRYIRLRKAAQLMIQTDMQIKEIAFRIGIQDIKYFREQFFKLFDMNPSDFIRKYRKAFTPTLKLNSAISSQKIKN